MKKRFSSKIKSRFLPFKTTWHNLSEALTCHTVNPTPVMMDRFIEAGCTCLIETTYDTKGPSIKNVHSALRGREVCPVRVFFGRGRGFFICGRQHFLMKKLRIFKIYGVSSVRTDKGGWASADKEGGQFFAILCGRPLTGFSNPT